jgi:hypothetical protein
LFNQMHRSIQGMTKYFILISFLHAFFGIRSMAQGREFGLRAGVMAAETTNNGEMVEDLIPGFYGGLFIGRPVGSTFFTSFISGVEYLQNGYWTDDQNFRRLHYVGVPLAFRFHFGPFHLQPGVSANFKMAERLVEEGEDQLTDENRSSWFDLPIMMGAGVKIINVTIEARFHYGILDVNQGNRNHSLQVGLAYSF